MKYILLVMILVMVGCSQSKTNVSNLEASSVETNDEPQFVQCDNFIQIGKTYTFDKYNITQNNKSSVTFSNKSVFINTPFFDQECDIVKASYYKNITSSGYYYADLEIMFEDEICEARFSVGTTSRGLTIYYPKPSREIHYVLDYTH